MTDVDVTRRKLTLRRHAQQTRAALGEDRRRSIDMELAERLLAVVADVRPQRVLAYASFADEASVDGVIERLLEQGVEVQLPYITRTGDHLGTAAIPDLDDVVAGRWGIREPAARPEPTRPDRPGRGDDPDLVLTPGLAFDTRGGRLGYGRGYYDRLLSDLTGAVALGVCPEVLLVEEVPTESHDHPVDAVVTEHAVYRRGRP